MVVVVGNFSAMDRVCFLLCFCKEAAYPSRGKAMKRRDFLKSTAAVVLGGGLLSSPQSVSLNSGDLQIEPLEFPPTFCFMQQMLKDIERSFHTDVFRELNMT